MRASSSRAVGLAFALVATLACAACKPDDAPAPVCRAYLDCFFPGGVSAYPDGTFDGGLVPDEDGDLVPASYDYAAFDDPSTVEGIFAAFDTGGYCWRARLDGTRDPELADACAATCRRALAAECARRDAFAADGTREEPACLKEPTDDFTGDGVPSCSELAVVDGGA